MLGRDFLGGWGPLGMLKSDNITRTKGLEKLISFEILKFMI